MVFKLVAAHLSLDATPMIAPRGYSLYDVCRLIERDVACTSETLLLLAYALASLNALNLTPAPRQALVGRRRLISVTKFLCGISSRNEHEMNGILGHLCAHIG